MAPHCVVGIASNLWDLGMRCSLAPLRPVYEVPSDVASFLGDLGTRSCQMWPRSSETLVQGPVRCSLVPLRPGYEVPSDVASFLGDLGTRSRQMWPRSSEAWVRGPVRCGLVPRRPGYEVPSDVASSPSTLRPHWLEMLVWMQLDLRKFLHALYCIAKHQAS